MDYLLSEAQLKSMSNVEQWKTDGDCNVCRRRNYCSNQCSASKKNMQRRVASMMFTLSMEAYKQSCKRSYERRQAERKEV